jgi:hypothetical protein
MALLPTDLEDAEASVSDAGVDSGRELQGLGRFPDPRLAPEQDLGARHEPSCQYAIEFAYPEESPGRDPTTAAAGHRNNCTK